MTTAAPADLHRPPTRVAVAVALAAGAAFTLVYWVAVRTEPGQVLDAWSFSIVARFSAIAGLLTFLRVAVVVAAAGLAGGLGLVRLRERGGIDRVHVYAVAVVAVSAVLAQLLKDALPRPYLGEHAYTYNTLPSGHVTVVAALGVAAVALAPRWRAVVAAVCAPLVLVAMAANVLTFAHRAADVVAAVLLVAAVAAAAAPALSSRPADSPGRTG